MVRLVATRAGIVRPPLRLSHAGPAAVVWVGGTCLLAWTAYRENVGWAWATYALAALMVAFWLTQFFTETVLNSNSIALHWFGRQVRRVEISEIESAKRVRFMALALRLRNGSQVRWPLPIGNLAACQVVEYSLSGELSDRKATTTELALAAHRWKAIQEGWESALRSGVRYRMLPIGGDDRHDRAYGVLGCFFGVIIFWFVPVGVARSLVFPFWLVLASGLGFLALVATFSGKLSKRCEGEIAFGNDQMTLFFPEGATLKVPMSDTDWEGDYLGSIKKFRVNGYGFLIDRSRLVPVEHASTQSGKARI